MNYFLFNLSSVLAHSILLESKGVEPLDSAWCLNGGDPPAASTNESTDAMMRAFIQHLPALIKTQGEAILPSEQAKLDATKVISPQYAQLLNELYTTYGPGLNKIGSELDAQNRIASTNTDADILAGPGKRLSTNAQAIDRLLNPEFYKTRETTGNKLNELLNSISLNGPNPEAERLVNYENVRTGNIGNPSATVGVSNALRFGDERMKRQQLLAGATGAATNFLQPSKASFDPFGRQVANSGDSRFQGITPVGASAENTGSQLLGAVQGFTMQRNDINSKRRDALDRVNETMSSLPSISA